MTSDFNTEAAMEDMAAVQGVCKDCGNGTLNNELNEQFVAVEVKNSDYEVMVCKDCGSSHVDLVVL
jgi:hypothetical protein